MPPKNKKGRDKMLTRIFGAVTGGIRYNKLRKKKETYVQRLVLPSDEYSSRLE